MALTKCKECKKEVSDKAKTCPHCGVKDPGTKAVPVAGCLVLVLLVIFGVYSISSDDDKSTTTTTTEDISAPKPQKTPEEIATEKAAKAEEKRLAKEEQVKKEAACRKNIQCWGDEHNIAASFACDDLVEKLAKFSHEWTDGFLEPKFGNFRWKNRDQGVVTYIGDKIKFQNAFGAWQNIIYECDYDPINEVVLDVRAEAGRL